MTVEIWPAQMAPGLGLQRADNQTSCGNALREIRTARERDHLCAGDLSSDDVRDGWCDRDDREHNAVFRLTAARMIGECAFVAHKLS